MAEKELRVSKPEQDNRDVRTNKSHAVTHGARAAALALLAGASAGLFGCEADSYMNPSVVGRWEHTPTKMPILDRIASIEDDSGDLVEYSDPTPEDLIPKPRAYRFGPGDTLRATLYDWVSFGQPEVYELTVDARGFIEIPQLGRVPAQGRTSEQLVNELQILMRRLLPNPLASVQTGSQRESTFNLIGAVTSPGPYFIPKADYRILEAIHTGGRFDDSVREIYVIRQVALFDLPNPAGNPTSPDGNSNEGSNSGQNTTNENTNRNQQGLNQSGTNRSENPPAGTPPDLNSIIDEIAGPEKKDGSPGMLGSGVSGSGSRASARAIAATTSGVFAAQDAPKAVIDLPDEEPRTRSTQQSIAAPAAGWVYLNGQWVQVRSSGNFTSSRASGASTSDEQQVMTQRVIRIRMDQLLAGKQSFNIVVLPGDVIRVPSTESGIVYVSGQVQRPGSYGIPGSGLTLKQALTTAGGLADLAIPERVDLVRRVGKDQEATIRLNARAIFEATQPDLFLKSNDQINVGTNFWALPLAVIRGGFRASYGFGFLLDRNFGNDLFGAPPDNRGF